MAALSVFWDTNILIDFLLERPYESEATNEIFDRAYSADLRLFTCETAITTSLYVCRGTPVVKALLVFLDYTEVLSSNQTVIKEALHSSFKDKEDAIQYQIALHHKMDAFITRDRKDFTSNASPLLPVYSPKSFMKSWK